MAHQLNGLFPRSLLKAFSVLIFIILLKDVCNGQPQLIGPSQALVARAGDDVILPCHVEPAYDVSTKTLEWTRSSLDPRFVYVSRASQELEKLKNPSFKGRTSLFVDELKYGNISLKISKVKFNDTGTYKCYIPDLEKEALVKLVVASVAATSPAISLSGIDKNRGGVVLQCESAGWYPEPELLWLDGEGKLLSAGPTETLRGPDDLYTVSSRVTVEKRHSNNITCRVQQRNTNQSRETHIHVPEDFFEIPSSSSSLIIGLAVSLALCIMLLILSVVVLLRRKKKHMMKTNRSPEDQTDVEGAEVPLRKNQTDSGDAKGSSEEARETEQLNSSSSSTKTKKQTSCCPLTSRRKLLEEQQRREEAEKNLQDIEAKLSGNISQAQEDKQKMERLRNELDSTKQQLQQEKKAAENLKKKLEEKNRELSGNISQAQEEKQKMERLNKELDSTKQQLQLEKKAAENLKKKLEEKNRELENKLKDEKKRNEETKEKVKELQQEKKAAENLKKQLEEKNHELSGNISQAQEDKQKMERLRNELDSTKQQQQMNKLQKGDIILDKVDRYGLYICLRNTSSEDKMMTGWEIKLQIKDREFIIYKFQENLKAGEGLTLNGKEAMWNSGDNVKISLISNTGEEHRLN
ncbi:selection and upkeep of intraepithelial T-cells protein 6-like [Oreochromis aureus]|uniref:Ig-like domain-containing protein n=1 Tax=Oreochromis aureus TaxID=47969 RepID=A0AAZ1XNV3_OREAU|nr:selection and upkeep of intraepithelial T-cells protein 6-like [Oreochromis aureus]